MSKALKIIITIIAVLMIILDRNFVLIMVILFWGSVILDILQDILYNLKKINKWNKVCTEK